MGFRGGLGAGRGFVGGLEADTKSLKGVLEQV